MAFALGGMDSAIDSQAAALANLQSIQASMSSGGPVTGLPTPTPAFGAPVSGGSCCCGGCEGAATSTVSAAQGFLG